MRLELILTDEELKCLTYAMKDAFAMTEVRISNIVSCNGVYREYLVNQRKIYQKLMDKLILASNEYERQRRKKRCAMQ